MSFIVWILATAITIGVCAVGGWFPITLLVALLIAGIWAVIIWGGILFIDADDFF